MNPFGFETAGGAVNGSNLLFTTSSPYEAGSVQVYINGQLKEPSLVDGWVELGGMLIQLSEAPKTGDIVRVQYKAA